MNHNKLIQVLSETVTDGSVVSLVNKFLNAGVQIRSRFEEIPTGVPQGRPLSPILGNIMLNELDKELERRGLKFVRFADDCLILVRTPRAAESVKESISRYIVKPQKPHTGASVADCPIRNWRVISCDIL